MPDLDVAEDVTAIVRPVWAELASMQVVDREIRLDGPLAKAAEAGRSRPASEEVKGAVRAMYRKVGLDPTKTRPSSEALRRRVRKGHGLPRVNSLVDIVNWCSLETELPFGLYDLAAVRGRVSVRLGRPGEEYTGIRKDTVHVAGRLVLADEAGPFGNPTSDSARTMVTEATTRALVVIFVPASLESEVGRRALALTTGRATTYCTDAPS